MDISELRGISAQYGFRPDKKLGQNFLVDRNIREKILDLLPLAEDTRAVEIGPGFGAMTFSIAERIRKLYAVEKDPEICAIMDPRFKAAGNIELINADILDVDIGLFCAPEDRKCLVYGNVPYYITTPIIEKIISQKDRVGDIYMVVQEEMADRLTALPGSRDCGSISCFIRYNCEPFKIFRISNSCFFPKPGVNSCLLRLRILDAPPVTVKKEDQMFRIIRRAFSQRRKKALNPLSDPRFSSVSRDKWERAFDHSGIDRSARAESISLEQYAGLSDAIGSF